MKKITLLLLLFTSAIFLSAQNHKLVAVSVVSDGAEEGYVKLLKNYFESYLSECGYSIVEYSNTFSKGIDAYDAYLNSRSTVSEEDFENMDNELLADSVCVLTLSKIGDFYQIRYSKVRYGQTNASVVKMYPGLNDPKLILGKTAESQLQAAIVVILKNLNFATKQQIDNLTKKKQGIEKKRAQSNSQAIAASTFIPGMGQMLKGQAGAGCGFLFSELALFGGGTTCYFMKDKQSKIMAERGTSYEEYKTAKNNKEIYNIAMYCCFGAGAILHITNMCHAYLCENKKVAKRLFSFEPAIIPINEYSNTNLAVGVKWHYEF